LVTAVLGLPQVSRRTLCSSPVEPGKPVENVKGIAADAKTGRIYVTTINRLAAFDLTTDKMLWEKTFVRF
jgi:hypothetical protein